MKTLIWRMNLIRCLTSSCWMSYPLGMTQKADAPFPYPVWPLPEMAPAENTTCWKMAPSVITAAKVRQAVWLTFSLPGMAFARDGSGGEYHLLEDGSIGYYSSEGEAGRLAESMDDLFSLIVSCICCHDCCDAKQYVDSKTLEEYGQRQRNTNLEDMDMDSLQRVSDALGIPNGEPLAPVLERFRKATQRQPLYQ